MVGTEQDSSEPKVKMSGGGGLNSLNSVSKKIQIRTKKKILGVVREQYLRLIFDLLYIDIELLFVVLAALERI